MFKKIALISLFFIFSPWIFAQAADLNILPVSGVFDVGQEFSVDLKIDSTGETINAGQAKLSFSPEILAVKNISKEGSIFQFWLQEPEFSKEAGTVEFIGGTPNAVSGGSLQVIRITFVSKNAGPAELSFIDGAITIADGSGTNVLKNANGGKFSISSVKALPKGEIGAIPTPISITRVPVQAGTLPKEPQVQIPLYPDSSQWYNLTSQFTVSWELPADITGISTALNKNPLYQPPPKSEGLFDNKTLPAFTESGLYYFHIRFQNNRGWGPTSHYRLAIDTVPPLSFSIDVKTGLQSDNPSPELSFNTRDALSGIDSFAIQVNSSEPILLMSEIISRTVQEVEILPTGTGFLNVREGTSTSSKLITRIDPGGVYKFKSEKGGWYEIVLQDGRTGWIFGGYARKIGNGVVIKPPDSTYKFQPLLPGKYAIKVKATDRAGNSIDDVVELEILSIEVPQITFAAEKVIRSSGNVVLAKGHSFSNEEVVISLEDENEFLVLQSSANVNEKGEWEFLLDRELRRGDYYLSVQAKDSRGAVSLPTDKTKIKVRDRPLVSFAGVDVTFRELIYALLAIIIGSGAYFWRREIVHFARAHREALIVARDFKHSLTNIREGIDTLSETLKKDKLTQEDKAFSRATLKKLEDTIEKSEKYIGQDIEKMS